MTMFQSHLPHFTPLSPAPIASTVPKASAIDLLMFGNASMRSQPPEEVALMEIAIFPKLVLMLNDRKKIAPRRKYTWALRKRRAEISAKVTPPIKTTKTRERGPSDALTDINCHKVQVVTGQEMVKKLTKAIDESRKEQERVVAEKEKMVAVFKEIEQKAFIVQENYKRTQELINKHREVLNEAKGEYTKLKKTIDESRTAEVDTEYKLQDLKKLSKEWDVKGKGYRKRLDDLKVDLMKQIEQMQKDGIDPEKLQATLNSDTLNDTCDLKRALEMVALLEAQLKDMNPNLDSISEYRKKASLYNQRVEDLTMVTEERDELKKLYDELRKKRLDEFMAGFNTISLKLKEMYQMITLGGDAELELVDSLDPFSEGVVFSVRPPKKSWKNIANLSGGEKTFKFVSTGFCSPSLQAHTTLCNGRD